VDALAREPERLARAVLTRLGRPPMVSGLVSRRGPSDHGGTADNTSRCGRGKPVIARLPPQIEPRFGMLITPPAAPPHRGPERSSRSGLISASRLPGPFRALSCGASGRSLGGDRPQPGCVLLPPMACPWTAILLVRQGSAAGPGAPRLCAVMVLQDPAQQADQLLAFRLVRAGVSSSSWTSARSSSSRRRWAVPAGVMLMTLRRPVGGGRGRGRPGPRPASSLTAAATSLAVHRGVTAPGLALAGGARIRPARRADGSGTPRDPAVASLAGEQRVVPAVRLSADQPAGACPFSVAGLASSPVGMPASPTHSLAMPTKINVGIANVGQANDLVTSCPGIRAKGGRRCPPIQFLSTRVIGQAEKTLGAILDRQLTGTGLTEPQWVILTLAVTSGGTAERDQFHPHGGRRAEDQRS